MSDPAHPDVSPEPLERPKSILRGPIDQFDCDMLKMVNDCESSDVNFVVGKDKKVLYGHKALISKRCKFLKTMFLNAVITDDKATVVLQDPNPEIFYAFLEFIYTNRVSFEDVEQGTQVLKLSIDYELKELCQLCNEYLTDNLGAATASDIMQAAFELAQGELKESTMRYIEKNTTDVFKDQSFCNLTADAMCEILRSDALAIDEVDLVEKVGEWTAEQHKMMPGNHKVDLARPVVRHLRLPLLTKEELKTVYEANKRNRVISEEVFASTWKTLLFMEPEEPDSPLVKPRTGTKEREHHKEFIK